MSTFRGFDTYLISRAERAGSHWFDIDTLRYFDSFGGKSQRVGSDVYIVVSSERDSGQFAARDGQRRYSVRVFIFHSKSAERPWDDALTVETAAVDNGGPSSKFGAFTNGKSAGRYADKVAQSIREAFPELSSHGQDGTGDLTQQVASGYRVSKDAARKIADHVSSL